VGPQGLLVILPLPHILPALSHSCPTKRFLASTTDHQYHHILQHLSTASFSPKLSFAHKSLSSIRTHTTNIYPIRALVASCLLPISLLSCPPSVPQDTVELYSHVFFLASLGFYFTDACYNSSIHFILYGRFFSFPLD